MGTVNYSIKLSHFQNLKFHGYFNNDWASSIDDMKNITYFYFSFGLGLFSWCSKKQDEVAQSMVEDK